MRIIVYPLEPLFRRVRIDLGRGQGSMAQQFFDGHQVGPAIHEVGREGVAKRVGTESGCCTGHFEKSRNTFLNGPPVESSPPAGQQ